MGVNFRTGLMDLSSSLIGQTRVNATALATHANILVASTESATVSPNIGTATLPLTTSALPTHLHQNEWFTRHARRLIQERAANGDDLLQANKKLREIFHSDLETPIKLRSFWTLI